MQGHTYSINENVKVLVTVSSQALEKLTNIDRNNKGLVQQDRKGYRTERFHKAGIRHNQYKRCEFKEVMP